MLPDIKQTRTLQKEVKLLRSFMIGVAGTDKEGAYRPEFVKSILSSVNENPTHTFRDAKSFLAHLDAA